MMEPSLLIQHESKDSVQGDESLSVRSLSNMLSEVVDWESFGINLGIEMHKLDEIKAMCGGDLVMCKNRMYDTWLRRCTNASWRDVLQALEKIGEMKVAQKILQTQLEGQSSLQKQRSIDIATDSPQTRVRAMSNGNGTTTIIVNMASHQNVPSTVSAHVTDTRGTTASEKPTALEKPLSKQASGDSPFPNELVLPGTASCSSNSESSENSLVNLLKSITIEDPQQIEVTCRVYNADTNNLIQSSKGPLTRDIKLTSRPRLQEFSSQVTRGTNLRLAISTDSNCYIYILNIGTSGKTSILLPNEYELDNHFAANQTYYFPDKDYGFEIDGPPGKETIQVMALSYKLESLDKMAVAGVRESEIYRDISVRRKKTLACSSERKGFAQIQFSVK